MSRGRAQVLPFCYAGFAMRQLDEAFHILSDYHDAHDLRMVPVLVDKLRDIIVARGYASSIGLHKVAYNGRNILGGVKFYDPPYAGASAGVEIYYNQALSKEWERAVACKEMCHAILDEDDDRVTNARDLIPHIQALHANILPTSAVQSEFMAEVLAVELLMPYELRCHHIEDFSSGKVSARELGLRYWLPPYFVSMAMTPALFSIVEQARPKRVDINKRRAAAAE